MTYIWFQKTPCDGHMITILVKLFSPPVCLATKKSHNYIQSSNPFAVLKCYISYNNYIKQLKKIIGLMYTLEVFDS